MGFVDLKGGLKKSSRMEKRESRMEGMDEEDLPEKARVRVEVDGEWI